VQAQSFAKAMRTDMMFPLFSLLACFPNGTVSSLHAAHAIKVQNKLLSAIRLTIVFAVICENLPGALHRRWLMSACGTNRRVIHYQFVNFLG
jgi:hypothetical protein